MQKLFISLFGIPFFIIISACSADTDYPIKQVTTGIYYHQGVHEDPAESNIGAIANVGFIIGQECVAVVDSGGSYLEGTYLRQSIKNITDLPICYVINTHVHPDHMFGNAAFKEDKPIFIGHEKLPAAIAARKDFFAKSFKQTLGKAYKGTEFIAPSKTASIGQAITIDLGQRELILTAHSTSHTDHDLTVLDKNTKTLWTGDLLFVDRIPAMDGSINGWIKTMTEMQAMELNFLIPGHGPAGANNLQQGIQKQLDYFTLIRDEIRIIIENFGSIDQASKQVGLLEKKKWELFEHYHRRNVTASFVELEWE